MQLGTNAGARLSFYLLRNAVPAFCQASHLHYTALCLPISRKACKGHGRHAQLNAEHLHSPELKSRTTAACVVDMTMSMGLRLKLPLMLAWPAW